MEGLGHKETLETYQSKLNERLDNIDEEETVENNWKKIQRTIRETAVETMRYQKEDERE